MTEPGTSLGTALASLLESARAAGVDEAVARAEGEALAATVSESASGAWRHWAAQTGGDRSAEEFTAAASRGRRWRSTPTPTLTRLAAERDGEAAAYAKALALVCTAAAGLGTPTAQTVGNASSAAAAQLGAFIPVGPNSPQVAPGPNSPQVAPGPNSPQVASGPNSPQVAPPAGPTAEFTAGVRGLWDEVMGQLSTLRARPDTTRPDRTGSAFDLDLSADPWAPGRFPDLTGAVASGSGAGPAGEAPARSPRLQGAAHGAGPDSAEPNGQAVGAPPVPAEDEAAKPGTPEVPTKSLDELLAELDALTGLADVKAEIHRQVAVLRIEAKRVTAGLRTPDLTRHLVFTGNPGTGKTTVARLVAGIYRALELLSKGQLVEVDRSELVAGYLGQTAIKTSDVVTSAVGGVLFIDEAYSLAGDQYGTEAVDTLVKEMEDKRDDLVVVVAGYPVPMEFFIAQNPGLASRFRTTITFADYTDDELVAIFCSIAEGADYDSGDAVVARFREMLGGVERGPSFGNGRYARNVFEAAVGRQAWRLRELEEPTVEQLRSLDPDDLADPEENTGPQGTLDAQEQTTPTKDEPTKVEPTKLEPTKNEPTEDEATEDDARRTAEKS